MKNRLHYMYYKCRCFTLAPGKSGKSEFHGMNSLLENRQSVKESIPVPLRYLKLPSISYELKFNYC